MPADGVIRTPLLTSTPRRQPESINYTPTKNDSSTPNSSILPVWDTSSDSSYYTHYQGDVEEGGVQVITPGYKSISLYEEISKTLSESHHTHNHEDSKEMLLESSTSSSCGNSLEFLLTFTKISHPESSEDLAREVTNSYYDSLHSTLREISHKDITQQQLSNNKSVQHNCDGQLSTTCILLCIHCNDHFYKIY